MSLELCSDKSCPAECTILEMLPGDIAEIVVPPIINMEGLRLGAVHEIILCCWTQIQLGRTYINLSTGMDWCEKNWHAVGLLRLLEVGEKLQITQGRVC